MDAISRSKFWGQPRADTLWDIWERHEARIKFFEGFYFANKKLNAPFN